MKEEVLIKSQAVLSLLLKFKEKNIVTFLHLDVREKSSVFSPSFIASRKVDSVIKSSLSGACKKLGSKNQSKS